MAVINVNTAKNESAAGKMDPELGQGQAGLNETVRCDKCSVDGGSGGDGGAQVGVPSGTGADTTGSWPLTVVTTAKLHFPEVVPLAMKKTLVVGVELLILSAWTILVLIITHDAAFVDNFGYGSGSNSNAKGNPCQKARVSPYWYDQVNNLFAAHPKISSNDDIQALFVLGFSTEFGLILLFAILVYGLYQERIWKLWIWIGIQVAFTVLHIYGYVVFAQELGAWLDFNGVAHLICIIIRILVILFVFNIICALYKKAGAKERVRRQLVCPHCRERRLELVRAHMAECLRKHESPTDTDTDANTKAEQPYKESYM